MDLGEYPLLNRPALMLIVLKEAAGGPATIEDCRRRLDEELARAHERPRVKAGRIIAELRDVREHLLAAALLTPSGGERFALTQRGRKVLDEHPMGVDETVLMQFPEFRAFIRGFARRRTIDDPRLPRYDEGYAAHRAGQALTDNPYPPDTIDHLAWENGWSEARDTGDERRRRR